ncbi:MAG TPA: hypothetical protein DET40_06725 [Lentisphaeria bacterium]|nr:MAG: hypothetical protein A2X45_07575 [Lentisphaerae bacterium GWF2_50_93]HCE43223.1 hypothetical protein [Lentisphaeria bacterium]
MKQIILSVMVGVFLATVCLINTDALADNNAPKKDPAAKPADNQVAAVPTEAEFMKVINDKCLRCHKKACVSVDSLKQSKWVVPGKPENSPAYKVIGKNKKPGGTYHNLKDDEKKIVNDFIKNMK